MRADHPAAACPPPQMLPPSAPQCCCYRKTAGAAASGTSILASFFSPGHNRSKCSRKWPRGAPPAQNQTSSCPDVPEPRHPEEDLEGNRGQIWVFNHTSHTKLPGWLFSSKLKDSRNETSISGGSSVLHLREAELYLWTGEESR